MFTTGFQYLSPPCTIRYIAVTEMVRITVYNVVDYTFMCCVCGLYF